MGCYVTIQVLEEIAEVNFSHFVRADFRKGILHLDSEVFVQLLTAALDSFRAGKAIPLDLVRIFDGEGVVDRNGHFDRCIKIPIEDELLAESGGDIVWRTSERSFIETLGLCLQENPNVKYSSREDKEKTMRFIEAVKKQSF